LVGQLLLELPTLDNLPCQPCVCLDEPRGSPPNPLVELGVCAAYLLLGPLALRHVVLNPDEVDESPPSSYTGESRSSFQNKVPSFR